MKNFIKSTIQSSKEIIIEISSSRPLVGISIGHAVTHWYPVSFFIILPFIQQSFGLSYTEVGFIISIKYLMSAFSNIPGGMIVDIIGKRHLLMAFALCWVGIPYFLMGVFNNYLVVILCAVLIGIGNNIWHPAAITELRNLFSDRKGWAIGIHSTAANIGDAIAPIFVGFLLLSLTWDKVVMINLIPGLLMAFVIWRLLRNLDPAKLETSDKVIKKDVGKQEERLTLREYISGFLGMLKSPGLLATIFISAVRSFAQNTLRTFLPLYFVNVQLMSSIVVGIYISIMEVSGAVAAPISGHFSDKKGRKIFVVMGMIGTAAAILFFTLANNIVFTGISLVAIGFFLYSLRPVLFAWALEQVSEKYGGTAVGMMFGLQSLFSSMAPLIGGWIADTWGIKVTFYALVGVLVICSLLSTLTSETGKNSPEEKTNVNV